LIHKYLLDLFATYCYIFCLNLIVKIHLPTYPPGVHSIRETIEPRDLNLDLQAFTSNIEALLRLDRHDPYLQFEFNLSTIVRLQCDRCLTDFDYSLQIKAPMLYVIGRTQPADAHDDPEMVSVPANTVDLDISTDLRDNLILSFPSKCLCSEECKGLCPICGADLNLQPCTCASKRSD